MKQLHETQLLILKKLLFSNGLKFSELQVQLWTASNQLTFHIEKVIAAWLCSKEGDLYHLTVQWKEYANTMDTGELFVKKQAKLWAMICCTKENEDGSWSMLIHTRKKQPFWWKQWFLTGKIHRWESPLDTAQRELLEESELKWTATLIKIVHYFEHEKSTGKLLDDKYLYLCHIHNPEGTPVSSIEWVVERVREDEIEKYIENPYRSHEDLLGLYQEVKNFWWEVTYQEYRWETDDF